jgi:hypothetical protein
LEVWIEVDDGNIWQKNKSRDEMQQRKPTLYLFSAYAYTKTVNIYVISIPQLVSLHNILSQVVDLSTVRGN